MVLARITNYKQSHQSGWDNIPHACIKVKHNLGYAWFGLIIMCGESDEDSLKDITRDELSKIMIEAIYDVCDVVEILTDIDRLVTTIDDIVTKKYKPTAFVSGTELLQMTLDNNVRVIVYQEGETLPDDVTAKGGFALSVNADGIEYTGILHHRGIILSNYISQENALEVVTRELKNAFPNFLANATINIACTLVPQ